MRKVITYGTFDLFHQGHYNIIKRAKDLGDYLIVGVTSESFDIERGKLNVRDSLIKRIENVRDTGLADEIIIEEYQGQKIHDIIKYNVDVLVVGSDWRGKFDYLKEYCEVNYLERTKNISSTMLREQQQIYKIGIITDNNSDGGFVLESKYISGINVEKVFCEDAALAEEFCHEYELYEHSNDLDTFLEDLHIVFVNVKQSDRERYVRKAIEKKKYVVCPSPISTNPVVAKELLDEARAQEVFIVDCIVTAYLRAFTQLVWMLRGGVIGDIVNVRCSMSNPASSKPSNVTDMMTYPLLVCLRILGLDYESLDTTAISAVNGELTFEKILLKYKNAIADIDVFSSDVMKSGIRILGTKGCVDIPDDWWNMGYFEISLDGEYTKQRYSYNFEGNGLRYLLQEMVIMIGDHRKAGTRVFPEEIVKLSEILSSINP